MNFIDLTENEILNIEQVDIQHKRIADLINQLHKQLGAKFQNQAQLLLNDLQLTLRDHFDTEENLMKEHNYVNFFSHKMEHDRFFNKVKDYYTEVKAGNNELDLEFLKSARRWFFNHFELNDKKCAAHLRAQGVC